MALFGKKKTLPKKKQTPDELAQVAAEKVTLEEERVYRRGAVGIRDLVAPASFEVNPAFVRLGELYATTVFVVTYPRYISVGWSYPIISMNRSLDISMFFYPIKAEVILKQLKNKVGALEAQIIMDAEKGAPRDPLRETALRDIEKLRDDLTQGVEHFFQYAFYVTIYARTLDDLDKVVQEIDSTFGAKLIFSKRVFYQAEQGYNSCLPMGNDELMITFNMNSSPIASSFPFICADLTSDSGVLYGLNKHNSSLIVFDRFSMQNPNMVVFATSGAGKSFAVKLEILRALMLGTDVIVIDPEMEYKHLSDAVGGTYINISLSSDSKINPFDLPRPMDQSMTAEDIIRGAVITVKGLLRIMLGAITTAEDSILDRALLEAYAKKDIVPGINPTELGQYEPPILQDFEDVLSGMTGSGDLVERLKKYTEGTFAGLLNSSTTVDMKNQFVIFSVRDLEDELRPMAIYTIVNYIWNVVRSSSKKRILVIDEAWWLMQHEDSAKFIFALVKRCRKYYLGVTTITQDVNDFLTSSYGQAIINNSAIQLLLKQSPAAIDLIQKTFLLTETEKFMLLESDVGNGIFFAGSSHVGIQIVASYTEEQLITTDPRQLLEIEEEKKRFTEATEKQ
jgi:type IV secretory pathway VirB4 component